MRRNLYFIFCIFLTINVSAQEPQNLGKQVNSASTDAEPKISPDGKTLYFCRRQDSANVGGYLAAADIWYTELLPSGKWTKAKNPRKPLNDTSFNQVIGIRSDGHAMLINGGYQPNVDTRVYIAYKNDQGEWSKPEPLFFEGFSAKQAGDQNFAVSADFQTLIISMAWKNETEGEFDLFVSFWDNTQKKWSKPRTLGKTLNTHLSEVFPVLANDNRTLYFSSKGHGGYGSYDIFMSKRLDESWEMWSQPKNLGANINSAGYDADFTVDAKAEYAYISRDANTFGSFDIFQIKLPEDIKPEPVILLTGKVLDQKNGKQIAEKITYFDDKGKKLGQMSSTASENYHITLACGQKYRVVAGGTNYFEAEKWIDLTQKKAYEEIIQDFRLKMNKNLAPTAGTSETIEKINFSFAKFDFSSKYYTYLNEIITKMTQNDTLNLEIQGHTDNIGTDENNQILSEKRAKIIADYLIKKGIPENRIQVKGMGESSPIESNDSANGRAKNRRVELIFK